MRRPALAIVAAALALVAGPGPARAAEWGNIVPGTSTMDTVRGRYGGPTRTTTQKVDGYDTAQWVYEGAQAPAGMRRMVVDFGILLPSGYRPNVVRSFLLEPKAGVFTRNHIVNGWGEPTSVSRAGEPPPRFFYASGLLVSFDKDGWIAESMLFTPPQPDPEPPKR